jgi:hypothetical protein
LALASGSLACGADPKGAAAGAAGADATGGTEVGSAGAADAAGTANGGNAGGGAAGGAGEGALQPHALASTSYGNCALGAEGHVHCWGAAPGEWTVPDGAFVEIVGGANNVCAIRADRSFVCFTEPVGMPSPLDYAPTTMAREVAVYQLAICALEANGSAKCGQSPASAVDVSPPEGLQLEHISAGAYFACGLLAVDGSAKCWGSAGDTGASCPAGQLDAPKGTFKAIASGGLSSCAIDQEGALACWGAGKPGDDPAATCKDVELNFGQSAPPKGSFKTVSVGVRHACGVKSDGSVACWGAGTADVCTIDTNYDCRQSRPPAGKFEQVTVGLNHSCAITADRKVQCWGYNGSPVDGRTMPPAVFQ